MNTIGALTKPQLDQRLNEIIRKGLRDSELGSMQCPTCGGHEQHAVKCSDTTTPPAPEPPKPEPDSDRDTK